MARQRYSTKAIQKKSRFYFLLSVIFIFVMIKWGLPLTVRLIANSGKAASVNHDPNDTIPPQKPLLAALPEATNSGVIRVSGVTEKDAKLNLWLNQQKIETLSANGEGEFDIKINLEEGVNEIYVIAEDSAGNSSHSDTQSVSFDNSVLKISLEQPQPGAKYFGLSEQQLEVKGKINKPKARLRLDNSFISVDSEGNFSQKIGLQEGDNQVILFAQDPAGNTDELVISVSYTR